MQENYLVDVSAFEVQLSAWRTQYSVGVAPTQLPALFDGCYFCLDALMDPDVRRQAKEYVRVLGGQVCCQYTVLNSACCTSAPPVSRCVDYAVHVGIPTPMLGATPPLQDCGCCLSIRGVLFPLWKRAWQRCTILEH